MLGVPARSRGQVAHDGADTDDTPLSPSPQPLSPSLPWSPSPISPSPSSLSMLTADGGIDEAEHETVLGCARGVMEHSTTGRQGMIQHEITSYLEGKQLFDSFDTDGDGYLVKAEALVKGGGEDGWRHSLEAYDSNEDEKLGYDEFIALLAGQREHEVEEQISHNVCNASMVSTDTEWTGDGSYYESPVYQKLLAQRSHEIRAAEASIAVDTMSMMSARRDHLGIIFAAADTDNDGKVSLAEYTTAGKSSRFAVVQGGFKEAMDSNGDGVVSESESLGAAAFEFGVIDGDRDGIVSAFELENTLEDKGWLRTKDWHVAQTLATDESMPHLITACIETHWGDAPEEDYANEEACGSLADDKSESDELSKEHMNVSASTRRLAKKIKTKKEEQTELMTNGLQAGYKTVTKILATDFCWIKTYDRGAGIPAGCKPGWEQRGAMCYRTCHGGSRNWWDLEFCNWGCPSGSHETAGYWCRTNGGTRGKTNGCCGKCWPGNWCCRGCHCGTCPSGYHSTGCFCEPCVTRASILLCYSLPLHPTSTARYAHTRRAVSLLAGTRLAGGASTRRE